jgi:hypothetical protein
MKPDKIFREKAEESSARHQLTTASAEANGTATATTGLQGCAPPYYANFLTP